MSNNKFPTMERLALAETQNGYEQSQQTHTIVCKNCSREFQASSKQAAVCPRCKVTRAPIVYLYTCPDGRSYVGGVSDGRKRDDRGIERSNPRLEEAFKQYPPETWTYEVLERLPPGCSRQELREAEQRHIDRLQTWSPEFGFIPPFGLETDQRNALADKLGRKIGATTSRSFRTLA